MLDPKALTKLMVPLMQEYITFVPIPIIQIPNHDQKLVNSSLILSPLSTIPHNNLDASPILLTPQVKVLLGQLAMVEGHRITELEDQHLGVEGSGRDVLRLGVQVQHRRVGARWGWQMAQV
jgi:hypothetical protein